jgi:hypothetical protein
MLLVLLLAQVHLSIFRDFVIIKPMDTSIPTDPALATPAQNSENTNNPLLAVASSAVVLPDCSQDVEGEGFDRKLIWAIINNPELDEFLKPPASELRRLLDAIARTRRKCMLGDCPTALE